VSALIRLLLACTFAVTFAVPVAAHDVRQIGDYEFVVGFIGEPVFTGEKSGLELVVTKAGTPIEGLETALVAAVIYGDAQRARQASTRSRNWQPGSSPSNSQPPQASPSTHDAAGKQRPRCRWRSRSAHSERSWV
jgi:hypothetical protein